MNKRAPVYDPRGYETPLGLNRYTLLIWYSLILCFMSNVVGCPDLVKKLLLMNNTGASTTENSFVQLQTIEQIVNRGFATATTSSFIIASVCNYDTPRMNGVWALALFMIGHVLLFNAETTLMNTAGIVMISATFSASFNAHVSISALFPSKSEMVYDVLAAVPELSTLAYYIVIWIYRMLDETQTNNNSMALLNAVQIYLGVLFCVSIIHLATIPSKPYNDSITQEYETRMARTPARPKRFSAKIAKTRLIKRLQAKLQVMNLDEHFLLWRLTLIEQVVHPLFWCIGAVFAAGLFRKYHVLTTFRFTVNEYALESGASQFYADVLAESLNISNALGCLSATFIARMSSQVSAWLQGCIIAIASLVTCVCLAIPNLHLQWVTVFSMCIWSSLIYTYLFVALTEYFGRTNVNNLQGLHLFMGSIWTYGHPFIMENIGWPFINDPHNEETYYSLHWNGTVREFQRVHICVAIMSLVACLPMIYEYKLLKRHVLKLQADGLQAAPAPRTPMDDFTNEAPSVSQPKTPYTNAPSPTPYTNAPSPSQVEDRQRLLPGNNVLMPAEPGPSSFMFSDSLRRLSATNDGGDESRRDSNSSLAESELMEMIENADFNSVADLEKLSRALHLSVDDIIKLGEVFGHEDSDDGTSEELSRTDENGAQALRGNLPDFEEYNAVTNYRPYSDLGMGNIARRGSVANALGDMSQGLPTLAPPSPRNRQTNALNESVSSIENSVEATEEV